MRAQIDKMMHENERLEKERAAMLRWKPKTKSCSERNGGENRPETYLRSKSQMRSTPANGNPGPILWWKMRTKENS